MQLFKLFLKFFLRRIDFLNRSIYVIVIALIAQITAISTRQGLNEFFEEVMQRPQINDTWLYWPFRFVEAIFVGGSWITFSILLAILIPLIYLKYKLRPLPQSAHLINSQLRQAKDLMSNFKTTTAGQLIDKAIENIDDSYTDETTKNQLKANAYFLKGLCGIQDENGKHAFWNFVTSYELHASKEEYKERAATSYYHLGKKENAIKLANELFQYNPKNQRANAIKLHLDPAFNIDQIDPEVSNSHTFKRIIVSFLLPDKKDKEVSQILTNELNENPLPDKVTFENTDYWCLIGRYSFHLGFLDQPNSFTGHKPDYSQNNLIKYANKILGILNAALINTEMLENSKSLQIAVFYFHYSSYLITADENSALKMKSFFLRYFRNDDEIGTQTASEVLIALNQLHKYEDVLDVTSKIDIEKNRQLGIMEFAAFTGLRKVEEATASFLKYLGGVEIIGDVELNNLFFIIDFLIQEFQDIQQFFATHIQSKRFERENDKTLVYCYCHRYLSEKRKEIGEHEDIIISEYGSRNRNTQYAILVLFQSLSELPRVNRLIEEYHDWRSEQLPRIMLTGNLVRLKSDANLLLEVLKFSRVHEPDEQYLLEELKIYLIMENTPEVLEITTIGRSLFPDNSNFNFYYIQTLYKNKDAEALKTHLTNELHRINFHWKQKFAIARVCIEYNKVQLGLELAYRVVMSRMDSPLIKEHYFALTTTLLNREEIPWPEKIEIDSVAQLSIEDQKQFLRIDNNAVEEHWLARQILDLKVGESKEIQDDVRNRKVKVTILKIFDKYAGLAAMIMSEVEKSEFSGMTMRSISFDGSDISTLNKKLVQEFGEEGDIRKIKQDEAFTKYHSAQISFTELVRTVSNDKALDIYGNLTSPYSEGFLVVPQIFFSKFRIIDGSEFVIDLTTLPILKKITDDFPDLITNKFIISQFAIEYLENELSDAKALPEERMSISITSVGVQPIFYPPGHKERRIEILEDMLAWIKKRCEIKYSTEKLDMALKHPDLVRDADLYYNYFIDTVFISTKRILISDDSLHQTRFGGYYPTVSSEYYFNSMYSESYRPKILPLLITNHYVGIKIYKEDLEWEYKKPYYGGKSTFHYCLQNLSFPVCQNPEIVSEAFDFLRDIYADNGPLDYKKDISQKVLVNLIRGYPDYNQQRNLIEALIRGKFRLLPIQLKEILNDLQTVEQIIANS